MKKYQRKLLGVLVGVAIVLALLKLRPSHEERPPERSSAAVGAMPSNSVDPVIAPQRLVQGGIVNSNLFEALNDLVGQLEKGSPASNKQLLSDFFQNRLRTQVSPDTIEQLIRFLDSGKDGATGMKFRVGPHHNIEEWPTLRVAVLDWLGQLSPAEAARYADTIFAEKKSADEYAVALRNFSLGRPDDKGVLADHFVSLLKNDVWQAAPTAGYLEAFDVAVHIAEGSLVAPLAEHLGTDASDPLRKASFIALDRMAQANPPAILTEASKDPSLAKLPRIRAGILGRADLRDANQKSLLESYLLDPAVGDEEISFWVQAFPNGSGVMTHSLLSENRTGTYADLAQQDRHALGQIQEWQRDERFRSRWPALKKLEARLVNYVASAVRGGVLPPTP